MTHQAIPTEKDISECMRNTITHMLNYPEPDAVLNIESHFFDVILFAQSCAYDLDVGKELWLNKQRWSRLMREYVPKEPLERFVSQAKEILDGKARDGATANMFFRDPDRYAKKHRWGGCLMGATFRGDNRKFVPQLTFYSRTTYMGYMALLDAGIAHNIARLIGPYEDIHFRWYISSCQLHCFKTLPYIFSKPNLKKDMLAQIKVGQFRSPTWKHICNWYCKIVQAYEKYGKNMLAHEKYGPFKRIKRRWMEHMGYSTKNVPPSLSISDLGFEKCE